MPAEAEAPPLQRPSWERPIPVRRRQRAEHAGGRATGDVVRSLDLLAGVAIVLVGAVLATSGPGGGLVRMAFGALVVFVVPGYLLLEALLPHRDAHSMPKAMRAAASLGLSPAVVGLVALSTALLPGGFRPGLIVAAVTLACVAFAAAAIVRRRPAGTAATMPAPAPAGLGPRGS